MVNSPLRRPYLFGGGSFGADTLDCHDNEPDYYGHLERVPQPNPYGDNNDHHGY